MRRTWAAYPAAGPGAADAARLRDAAGRMLQANWCEGVTRDGVEYAYTRPDRVKYPDQFFWDSCFHAVAWSHIDPARARRELRTLVAAQRPDGLIGHTVFWRAGCAWRAPSRTTSSRRSDGSTATIQPPLLAWAWAEVADRSPDDPGFRAEGLAPLRRCTPGSTGSAPTGTACSASSSRTSRAWTPRRPTTRPSGRRAHPFPGFLHLLLLQPAPRLLVPAGRRRGRLPRGRPAGQHRLGAGLGGDGAVGGAGRRRAGRPRHGGAGRAALGPGARDLPPAGPGRAPAARRHLGRPGAARPARPARRGGRGGWSRSSCSTRAGSGCRSPCPA